jgi:hypothetical protein
VFIHTALKELSKMFFLKIAPTPVFLHEWRHLAVKKVVAEDEGV